MDLLEQQDGVVTRAQALRLVSAAALRHLVASGRWQVPHLGIYVNHSGPVTERQRRWIAVLGCRAYLAGPTALDLFGLRGFPHRTSSV